MNKPALYHQLNQLSSRDSHQIIQDYAETLNWRPDGCDAVLDAGCGAGDITHGIILPFLPPHFERLVGVDVSKEMIDYARRTHIHPKLTFQQFDLGSDLESQSLAGVEPFDHIFSAFCLTWIRNPRICLETFHKLLKPNGDVLLWWSPNKRNAYEELAKNDRWSKYMTDIDRFIPQYQYWEHPETEFQRLLNECGFTNCSVKVYDKTDNRSYEAMRNLLYAVNPFVDRIPADEKDAFLDDAIRQIAKKCHVYNGDIERNTKGCRFTYNYKLIVAYARKK